MPEAEKLASELGISQNIVEILASRGLETREEMDCFLSPSLKHLPSPDCIPGLEKAASLLATALKRGDLCAVWGDYDVDGVTSAAVVKEFFTAHGFPLKCFLPNREKHGYGLSSEGIDKLQQEGVKLLLTVDCGISDIEAVAYARKLGMTVIVSDHHLPADILPEAQAICNPRLDPSENNPCANLAGVGVAWMLMAALNRLLPEPHMDMRSLLDFVALGTVADLVPLSGVNRILVKNGLLLIKEAARSGIGALKEVSGYDRLAVLGAGQIGFGLAPRINAAGRLGDPRLALDLLLAADLATARPLAKKLDAMNSERRSTENEILEQAMEQAKALLAENPKSMGLVLYAEDWHGGVIGIVASRIVEAFYRPAILLCAEGEGILKGSARSISEFDLYTGLEKCAALLSKFGGHRQAAGLSLPFENLVALRTAFHEAVVAQIGSEAFSATLKLESELALSEINFKLLQELELLQPYGMGNPEPVFFTPEVLVKEYRTFGQNHVELLLEQENSSALIPAKAWRMADVLPRELVGQITRFAFVPKVNTFRGTPTIELHIKDWQG